MLAPYRWIKDYADVQCSPDELAQKMIMTGSGVDAIEYAGRDIVNVVVGRIEKIERHPNADRLRICQVDIGTGELVQIVTGADNVFEGAHVPAAVAPAELPGGPIRRGKLRGEASNGMLCSGQELLLTEDDYPGAGVDGILILSGEPVPGTDIREFLDITGAVLDFEVGANRPDCLSMIGIAREASASVPCGFSLPEIAYGECSTPTDDVIRVRVEDPDLCPRFVAAAAVDVQIQESPDWVKKRLQEAGVRPINNIVDITNFVMLETGQPMHAYDAAKIRGSEIIVRRARQGEAMKTLDGKERTFSDSMLLICDKEGPIGVAGVMGGLDSEITQATKTVVFEAAKFPYGNIRQTSRALGLATESSMRFSKGVDAATTMFAMQRALTLLEALGAGVPATGMIDILHEDLSPRIVKTTGAKVNEILGTDISAREMQKLLERVFIHTGLIGDELICTVPAFRSDIAGPNDIAEEVGRMHGYDNIPETNAQVEMREGRITEEESKKDRMCRYLTDNGFFECMNYPFAGRGDYENVCMEVPDSVVIVNPLGEDRSMMRTLLLPAVLRTVALNLNNGNRNLRLFEQGRVFVPGERQLLPEEHVHMCLAAVGPDADFDTLRSMVENVVFLATGRDLRVRREQEPYLSPAASGKIIVKGDTIGVIGGIAPDACRRFGIGVPVWAAEIDLTELFSVKEAQVHYREIPRFPAATRDIAVVVDFETGAGELLEEIRKAGGAAVEEASVLSVYSGKPLSAGEKSVAVALTLRGRDSTLQDRQVDEIMSRILKALEKRFDARLR